jgi:hypothetical protein
MRIGYVIAGVANLLAILDLPYGYYEALRWLVTIAAIALTIQASSRYARGWLLLSLPAFLIWNPFFGATMEKGSWFFLNVAAGLAFLATVKDERLG